MSISLVSGFPTDVTGTGLTSESITASSADDAVLLLIRNVSSGSTKSISSITKASGTGATTTWTRVGTALTSSSGGTYWDYELWMAQVTTAGTLNLTIAWTPSAPTATVEIVAFELSSGLGSTVWGTVATGTTKSGSSTAISWNSITSDATHSLQAFFGYCDYAVGGTFTSLTSGFTGYNPYNYTIYDLGLATSTGYAPSVTNNASGTWITVGWIIDAASAASSVNSNFFMLF